MLALWLSLTTALAGPCDTAMTVDELRGLAESAATGVNGDQTDNSATQAGAVYVRIIAP